MFRPLDQLVAPHHGDADDISLHDAGPQVVERAHLEAAYAGATRVETRLHLISDVREADGELVFGRQHCECPDRVQWPADRGPARRRASIGASAGLRPKPRQRALPSGLPPRARPWNPLLGLGVGVGAYLVAGNSGVGTHTQPKQMDCKGTAFAGVQGRSPGRVRGGAPGACLRFTPLPCSPRPPVVCRQPWPR